MSTPENIGPEHDLDEDGEHDEDECWLCLRGETVTNSCRCGKCCRQLIIEVDVRDAEREPKIKERGRPIYEDFSHSQSGEREVAGYFLDGLDGRGCVFLDQQTNLCQIYETRPLLCRLFDCEGAGREQLIELGVISRDGTDNESETEHESADHDI